MSELAIAPLILAALGLFFGGVLALAYRFLRVEEDPRLNLVEALLPGSNCGACGEPGCRALAEKLISGEAAPSRCTVSSPEGVPFPSRPAGASMVDVNGCSKRRSLKVTKD